MVGRNFHGCCNNCPRDDSPSKQLLQHPFMGGCGGHVLGGWLDQAGIRLSQLSTKLKLKLKLKLSLAI